MHWRMRVLSPCSFVLPLVIFLLLIPSAVSQSNAKQHPWMNPNLSSDERASMVVKEMTLDEKISLLHGTGMEGLSPLSPLIVNSNGGAGYVPGIARLGIPPIQMSDALSRNVPKLPGAVQL